jgi:hypothetical protein
MTEAEYRRIHYWIERRLGKPQSCEVCLTTDPTKWYDWANLSGEYKKLVSDWERKCRKCHMAKDKMKATCKKGHNLAGNNLYINPRGHRFCRQCKRTTMHEWYINNKLEDK